MGAVAGLKKILSADVAFRLRFRVMFPGLLAENLEPKPFITKSRASPDSSIEAWAIRLEICDRVFRNPMEYR